MNRKFYGRFSTSCFFLIWVIFFAVIGVLINTLLYPKVFAHANTPVAIKIIMNIACYIFSLIFMVPTLWQLRGSAKRRKIVKKGKLVFGGSNFDIYRKEIRQNGWPMFVSYTLSFDYSSENVSPIEIRQYVSGKTADMLKSIKSNIPLKEYNGLVAFDEKAFYRMANGSLDLSTKYEESIKEFTELLETTKLIYESKVEVWDSKLLLENMKVKFTSDEKALIESIYKGYRYESKYTFNKETAAQFNGIFAKYPPKERNQPMFMTAFAGTKYLLAKDDSEDKYIVAMLALSALYFDPLAFMFLSHLFNTNKNDRFPKGNINYSAFSNIMRGLITKGKEFDFNAVRRYPSLVDENKYNFKKLIPAAYALQAINNNYDEAIVKELMEYKYLDDKYKEGIKQYYELKDSLKEQMAVTKDSKIIKKYEALQIQDMLGVMLYNIITDALEVLDHEKPLVDMCNLVDYK